MYKLQKRQMVLFVSFEVSFMNQLRVQAESFVQGVKMYPLHDCN